LGVPWAWDKRIGGDESAKLWVIVPPAIVVEAAFWIKLLAGETAQGVSGTFRPAYFSPGVVFD